MEAIARLRVERAQDAATSGKDAMCVVPLVKFPDATTSDEDADIIELILSATDGGQEDDK